MLKKFSFLILYFVFIGATVNPGGTRVTVGGAYNWFNTNYFSEWVDFDFTLGAETDSAGDITINSSSLITISTMRRDAVSWIEYSKDLGSDFKIRIKINQTAGVGNFYLGYIFILTNNQNGTVADIAALSNPDDRRIEFQTGKTNIALYVDDGSDNTASDSYTISQGTDYYCQLERNSGAVTCKIYSDSSYSTLLDTLDVSSVTLNFDIGEINYAASRDSASNPTDSVSYTMADMQIWE